MLASSPSPYELQRETSAAKVAPPAARWLLLWWLQRRSGCEAAVVLVVHEREDARALLECLLHSTCFLKEELEHRAIVGDTAVEAIYAARHADRAASTDHVVLETL